MTIKLATLTGIVVALAMFRLLPHLPNVSPVAAMALFGGAYFADKRLAFIVPFLALIFTDFFLGLHDTMLFVYAGFALTVVTGIWLAKRVTFTHTAAAAVFASLLFFLLSNFGVWWMSDGRYAPTLEGLAQCYVAALPFLQNSLVGNLVFTTVIFGGYEMLRQRFAVLDRAV